MKTVTAEDLKKSLDSAIAKLEEISSKTDLKDFGETKRTNNYLQWVAKKTDIIIGEKEYECVQEDKLRRGAVVWVEFGFNVGNEFGGRHPAIILRKTGQSVFVVPLSSQEPKEKKDYHVRVEKVYGFKNITRWANVLRIQCVSIQRIDLSASMGNVKGEVLDSINRALREKQIFG